ncbi:hypothetical protein EDD53_0552 [Pacificibacter maritimus]|uniref:Uncharacterized protein n=1 Tax=Pacificibacter maritimus TaxID=762213 RepID=A0A3N4VEV0_9RHOB|nr:hypothetical protein [Pacificibacter maritimus]RPE71434.1 hypothetical protein EDD53_0552 [Pacificibacter maritimus]
MKHQTNFADRLARIDAGKANVCGTVYVGETSQTSRKTTKHRKSTSLPDLPPSRLVVMTKGGVSGLLQVALLGTGLVYYLSQTSL